jgi:hypothetical protein
MDVLIRQHIVKPLLLALGGITARLDQIEAAIAERAKS